MKPKLKLISGSSLHTETVYSYGSTILRGRANGSPHRLSRDNGRREWVVQSHDGTIISRPHSFKLAKEAAAKWEEARP